MTGTFQPLLVALSVFIGIVSFFGAVDLLVHGTVARGRPRVAWLAGGVLTAALGIWSVNFVGMLALRLSSGPRLMPVGYDLVEMVLAIVVAAIALVIALRAASSGVPRALRAGMAGAAVGLGVLGTRYVLLGAMRTPVDIVHDPVFQAGAASVAVAGCIAVAMHLMRGSVGNSLPFRLRVAALMAAVTAGAHYTDAAGLRFTQTGRSIAIQSNQLIATDSLAVVAIVVVLLLVGLAMLTAMLDRRLERMSRESEQRAFLLHAARQLASSLDTDDVLQHLTAMLVPRVADYCIVHANTGAGMLQQVAAAHADPVRLPILTQLGRSYEPAIGSERSAIATTLRTTAPVLVSDVSSEDMARAAANPGIRPIVEALAPKSYLVVPLVAHGQRLGTITLATSTSGRRFGPEDLAMAELFATRAALAMHNARLHRDAQRAHEESLRATRLEASLVTARLDALRAQLNPHFLFNALNTIAMLVRQGEQDKALHGIVSLGELLRRLLAESTHRPTTLAAELSMVNSYVAIEQLRYGPKLEVVQSVAPEAHEAVIPSLMLQPLVENAIRHGIAHRREGGRVDIRAVRQDDVLVLEVHDTGPGFPEGWTERDARGIGLANTRERLGMHFGTYSTMDVGNGPHGGGAVRIVIPFETQSALAMSHETRSPLRPSV